MSQPLLQPSQPDFDPDSLYRASAVATGIEGFAALDAQQVALFHHQGYLVIQNAFDASEVAAALAGLLALIDGQVPDFTGVQFEAQADLANLTLEQKQDAVRKLMDFVGFDAALRHLAEHPALLAALARLMDDRPVLFQDMALLKPPHIGKEKPWHQDNAYFNVPPATTVVGVWIALDRAIVENGCMHIIPGSQQQGPVVHFKRRDWQICDSQVALGQVTAVPLEPGSLLLFHGLLHHGTPNSRSDLRRRAVQYHYKPAGVIETSLEARLAVFGSEGKDVSC
jgi:phytanoyl-CoA hydroxylase